MPKCGIGYAMELTGHHIDDVVNTMLWTQREMFFHVAR